MFCIISFRFCRSLKPHILGFTMVAATPEALRKKSLILPLLLAILVPAVSVAQNAPTAAQTAAAPARHAAKPRSMAGVVGADAKTFSDGKQKQWSVANPAAFIGYEKQRVNVKYVPMPGQNQIRVVSVKPAAPRLQVTAFKTDSAFRR